MLQEHRRGLLHVIRAGMESRVNSKNRAVGEVGAAAAPRYMNTAPTAHSALYRVRAHRSLGSLLMGRNKILFIKSVYGAQALQ